MAVMTNILTWLLFVVVAFMGAVLMKDYRDFSVMRKALVNRRVIGGVRSICVRLGLGGDDE